jgi:hypothetical protein
MKTYMLKKYLYGKKLYLRSIIEGDVGFRFSDLTHYSRLENELMQDEEMVKVFTVDKSSSELRINGHVISPENMTRDSELSFPTQHCFCLCLSNRKNSSELFRKFEADICIEVNVDLLLEFLNDFFPKKLEGIVVEARNITYYEKNFYPKDLAPLDLAFYKPDSFKHEAEFRIALFYPLNKPGFKTVGGCVVPFINENGSIHMTISYPDKVFLKQFVNDFSVR